MKLTAVIFLCCIACSLTAQYPGTGRSTTMLAQPINTLIQIILEETFTRYLKNYRTSTPERCTER